MCQRVVDLYPVSLSARSNYVTFTDEVLEALSPCVMSTDSLLR